MINEYQYVAWCLLNGVASGVVVISVGQLAWAATVQCFERPSVVPVFSTLSLWTIVVGAGWGAFLNVMGDAPRADAAVLNIGLAAWNMTVTLGLIVGTARATIVKRGRWP